MNKSRGSFVAISPSHDTVCFPAFCRIKASSATKVSAPLMIDDLSLIVVGILFDF
jgi:hypothetical protein